MNTADWSVNQILDYPFPDYSWPLAIGITWRNSNSEKREDVIELFDECRRRYPHALEFGHELALVYLERETTKDDAKAENILREINALYGAPDEEFLCRFGRLYKDRGDRLAAANGRRDALEMYRQACDWYAKAYNVRQGHYPGINQATLLLIQAALSENENDRIDFRRASAKLAASLLTNSRNWPRDFSDDNVWHAATAAEAYFLQQALPEAYRCYLEAVQKTNCQEFHRNSMRKQAERIQAAFRLVGVTDFGPLKDLDQLFAAPAANSADTVEPGDAESPGPENET